MARRLVWDPHLLQRWYSLEENVNRDAAARISISADAQPSWRNLRDDPLCNPYRVIFVKRTMIAKGSQEQFERLALNDVLIRDVVENQLGKIGLVGD